jgi:hypothetical protein
MDSFHHRILPVVFWLAFLALGFFTSFGQSSGTRQANEVVSLVNDRRCGCDSHAEAESPWPRKRVVSRQTEGTLEIFPKKIHLRSQLSPRAVAPTRSLTALSLMGDRVPACKCLTRKRHNSRS